MMRRKASAMESHERFSMNVLAPTFMASATIISASPLPPPAPPETLDTLGWPWPWPAPALSSSSWGVQWYLRHWRAQKNSLKSS
jgi:hypothetical protein